MNNKLATAIQHCRPKSRITFVSVLALLIAFAIQASPLMAAEKVRNSTQAVAETVPAPIPISKVDSHATDLSTQPNMRSTGVMVDAEGRVHVLCVDPSTPELASRLQSRVQATHQTISDR